MNQIKLFLSAIALPSSRNSSITSAGLLPKLSGRMYEHQALNPARAPNSSISGKPLVTHQVIMAGVDITIPAPKVLINPIPIILTWVGRT